MPRGVYIYKMCKYIYWSYVYTPAPQFIYLYITNMHTNIFTTHCFSYIYIYIYIVLCFGRFFSTNWIYMHIWEDLLGREAGKHHHQWYISHCHLFRIPPLPKLGVTLAAARRENFSSDFGCRSTWQKLGILREHGEGYTGKCWNRSGPTVRHGAEICREV